MMNTLNFDSHLLKRRLKALEKKDFLFLALLIAFGLVIRLLLMWHPGYTMDVDCFFRIWAQYLQETPFSGVYTKLAETTFEHAHPEIPYGIDVDYPPLYLYVISGLGYIAKLFHIPLDYTAISTRFLFKYPAMLADIGLALFAWNIARRHFRSKAPLWAAALVLFNPVILYNSAVWGQVDSLLALFAIGVLYLLATRRNLWAVALFALSITFKPHMLFLTPVVFIVLLLNSQYWKVLAAIPVFVGTMILALFPFTRTLNPFTALPWFADLLHNMEGKYKSLSMNMWNIWQAINGALPPGTKDTVKIVEDLPESVNSYVPSYHTMGLILIGILCAVVCFNLIRRRDEGTIFLSGAIMFLGVCMLGTRMHERYPLPAVMIMLFVGMYYVSMRPLFYLLTFLHLINLHSVLSSLLMGDEGAKYQFTPIEWLYRLTNHSFVVSSVTVFFYSSLFLMIAYLFYVSFGAKAKETAAELGYIANGFFLSLRHDIKGGATAVKDFLARPVFSENPLRLGRYVSYRATTCFNNWGFDWFESLSSIFFPDKMKKMALEDRRLDDWNGPEERENDISIFRLVIMKISEMLPDPASLFRFRPFSWFSRAFDPAIPLNRFTLADMSLFTFFVITAGIVFFFNYWNPPYMYFDEVYFAKTAYQFARLEHIYTSVGFPWETTHPHLGKLIQAGFIKYFGFWPWAYRIPNLLMAVFSTAFLYLLARDVLRSRRMGFFTALFFMFCGLSYSQGRLCTIDSPAVFFMILSMFCFYKYFAGLWPKLPALACTAVAIGLAIAAKWTSVFAMGMLIFLMFWRESAVLMAPVYSTSNVFKRWICYWFSSRGFELSPEENYLLDPAEIPEPLFVDEVSKAVEKPGETVEPATQEEANAQPAPAGGADFVQPRGSLLGWLKGMGLLVIFLIAIPLFIYAVSFVRLRYTNPNESSVTLTRSKYDYSIPGKLVWFAYTYEWPKKYKYEDRPEDIRTSVTVSTDSLMGIFALAIVRSREMYDYHSEVGHEERYKPHPYESRWFHWPLLLKLIWYDSWSSNYQNYSTKRVQGVVAIGNPLLFWFGLPCMLFLFWGAIEERRIGLLFIAAGFCFLYMPWVISPRQVTFLYHYLPAQIFLSMAVAFTMEDFWHERLTRWLSILFVIGVILVFFYFYPWLNDLSLSESGFKARMWSNAWGVGY